MNQKCVDTGWHAMSQQEDQPPMTRTSHEHVTLLTPDLQSSSFRTLRQEMMLFQLPSLWVSAMLSKANSSIISSKKSFYQLHGALRAFFCVAAMLQAEFLYRINQEQLLIHFQILNGLINKMGYLRLVPQSKHETYSHFTHALYVSVRANCSFRTSEFDCEFGHKVGYRIFHFVISDLNYSKHFRVFYDFYFYFSHVSILTVCVYMPTHEDYP